MKTFAIKHLHKFFIETFIVETCIYLIFYIVFKDAVIIYTAYSWCIFEELEIEDSNQHRTRKKFAMKGMKMWVGFEATPDLNITAFLYNSYDDI